MSYGIDIINAKGESTFHIDGNSMRILSSQILQAAQGNNVANGTRVNNFLLGSAALLKVYTVPYIGLGITCFAEVRPFMTFNGVVSSSIAKAQTAASTICAWQYINVGTASSAVEIWALPIRGGSVSAPTSPTIALIDKQLIIYEKGNV